MTTYGIDMKRFHENQNTRILVFWYRAGQCQQGHQTPLTPRLGFAETQTPFGQFPLVLCTHAAPLC